MERMVANRLSWYLEKGNMINNVQTGFKKNRSTIDQIIRLQDTINRGLRTNSHTLAVFLDFEKASDIDMESWTLNKTEKFRDKWQYVRMDKKFLIRANDTSESWKQAI